ncbi:MAG: PD-(D/E)XK nuclease family protein [Anaerolineales bacterium]|nr:MAG: PD-(D/E)XK nuclease family protein [Anaerolineales bacterium]
MSLPRGFIFSQSSLQDYVDCQRRFQLRYLLHQKWPAVEAEPYLENERRIDQGSKFHQIVHQHLVGVPENEIKISIANDEVLEAWWNNYLHSIRDGVLASIQLDNNPHFEELTLSAPVGDFRVLAKYDLLLCQTDGKWLIFDWKTSENHPKRKWLANRLQTHIYPYILSKAGACLGGGEAIDPDLVEMIYWFTNFPEQPERFSYNQASYNDDLRTISSLIAAIDQKTEAIFPLTPDTRRCLYCTYRSLCNRGVEAGDIHHLEEWLEPDAPDELRIDFDQIGEIEF